MKAKIVYVEWLDSDSMHGWNGKNNLDHMVNDQMHKCQSVGMLYKKTKDRIVLVQSIGESTVGEVLRIPMFAITKIRHVGVANVDWD